MSYGFQVFNNNGNVLIDTVAQSQMQITEVVTHSYGSNLTRAAGEFILWSTQHGSGTYTYTAFHQASDSSIIYNGGPTSTAEGLET